MTNKLVVIINSLKVPKIKKILLYEIKFLVPNYSCLQKPWLGGYRPQIPVLSVLNWICWTPPPEQNSWVRHCKVVEKTKTHILCNNINSQLDATIIVLLITLIISTCFGRSFRPSSGALNCVYSLWYNALAMLPAGDQDEVELILGMLLLTSRQHCRCIIPQSVNTV